MSGAIDFAMGNASKAIIRYVSHARSHEMFSAGAVGAVLSGQKAVLENGFLSEPVVSFQNYAISL